MFAVVESFEKECSLVFLTLALVFEKKGLQCIIDYFLTLDQDFLNNIQTRILFGNHFMQIQISRNTVEFVSNQL